MIGTLTPVRFSAVYGGAKSRVVTMSFSQQGRSNTRALKSHYSRPFQFVGELWLQMMCITYN